MTKTIKEIFSQAFGFSNDDQLNSLARILYHYEFDGTKRRSIPNDLNLKDILNNEISEEDLNKYLQENIFQKIRGSGERQQVDPSNDFSSETKQQLMRDFEKIGFVAEVLPNRDKEYKYVIIYGAAQNGMENRLNDFLGYFLPKINGDPKEIFFLVGKRDAWLDSESFAKEVLLEKINKLPAIPGKEKTLKTMDELEGEINEVYAKFSSLTEKRKGAVEYFTQKYKIEFPTEADIAEKIFESKKAESKKAESKKADLDGFKITIINAEKKTDGSRPDTTDTLKAFAKEVKLRKEDFNFDAVLAISNQPNVSAQALALRVDERLCCIDVVGKEGSRQVGQLNIFACELAGGIYRYLALSKEQQQGIKSDQLLSSQANPSQATADRGNDSGEFGKQVEAPSFVGQQLKI